MNNQFGQQPTDSLVNNQPVPAAPPDWSLPTNSPVNTMDNFQPQGNQPMQMPNDMMAVSGDPSIPQDTGQIPLDQMGFYQPSPESSLKGSGKVWIIATVVVILLAGGIVGFGFYKGWFGSKPAPVVEKPPVTTPDPVPVVPTPTSRDAQRKKDLIDLKTYLKKYYQVHQKYPLATTMQKTFDPNTTLIALVPEYFSKLPVDPASPTYYYGYKSDGKTFELTCALENKTDPSGILMGTYNIYKVTDSSYETPVTPITTTTNTTTTGTTAAIGTTTSGTVTPSAYPSSATTIPSTATTTTSLPNSSLTTGSGSVKNLTPTVNNN